MIKTSNFWLLDKEVNGDCQNGRNISSQRPIPHFNGGSLRLEQQTGASFLLKINLKKKRH